MIHQCNIITSESDKNGTQYQEFLFYSQDDLAGFVRISTHPASTIAYITELTSARAFQHIPPSIQAIYRENGYSGAISVPAGFGMQILDYSLEQLIQKHPSIKIVVICTLEKNRAILERSIFGHYSEPPPHIKKVTGGGECAAATIFLSDSN